MIERIKSEGLLITTFSKKPYNTLLPILALKPQSTQILFFEGEGGMVKRLVNILQKGGLSAETHLISSNSDIIPTVSQILEENNNLSPFFLIGDKHPIAAAEIVKYVLTTPQLSSKSSVFSWDAKAGNLHFILNDPGQNIVINPKFHLEAYINLMGVKTFSQLGISKPLKGQLELYKFMLANMPVLNPYLSQLRNYVITNSKRLKDPKPIITFYNVDYDNNAIFQEFITHLKDLEMIQEEITVYETKVDVTFNSRKDVELFDVIWLKDYVAYYLTQYFNEIPELGKIRYDVVLDWYDIKILPIDISHYSFNFFGSINNRVFMSIIGGEFGRLKTSQFYRQLQLLIMISNLLDGMGFLFYPASIPKDVKVRADFMNIVCYSPEELLALEEELLLPHGERIKLPSKQQTPEPEPNNAT